MSSESEFFVGYLPVPAGLRKHLSRIVTAIAMVVCASAVLLVYGQNPFAASKFEYQQVEDFQGLLLAQPYPAVAIPGQGLPWLLVGPGKHGITEAVRPLEGRQVRLKGQRIFRDGGDHMIEVLPGSLSPVGTGAESQTEMDLGEVQLTGEIVDSKCFFGVMNPGNGKVHRDCAVRCISGGIPPAFLVRDATGQSKTLLLAGVDNRELHREVLDYVAERVVIRGRLVRSAGRLILRAEPGAILRAPE
jgi:hypothetical protein